MGDWPAVNAVPIGTVLDFAGPARSIPPKYLPWDGSQISRTTYPLLFSYLNPTIGTFTVTLASPGVFTLNAHGLGDGDGIWFTTTGALPTGIVANTRYFVVNSTTNTFQVSATYGGAAINTSVSQSGVHTAYESPHGVGDGSTTFHLGDARGRASIGAGTGTATGATRWPVGRAPTSGKGGEETHTLITAEIPVHGHTVTDSGHDHQIHWGIAGGGVNFSDGGGANFHNEFTDSSGSNITIQNTGGGGAHNIMSPVAAFTKIVRAL